MAGWLKRAMGGGSEEDKAGPPKADPAHGVMARMETSMGEMLLYLYEDLAPNTVANFMHLASKGFYDGLTFHRVIADFMIQAGCPVGNGTGGPGWQIADEFVPGLTHDGPGVLSMANAGPNTGGSQFFITLGPADWLDGKHAIFGRVIKGRDVLEKIGGVDTDRSDRPTTPVNITRVTLYRDKQPIKEMQPSPRTV